MGFWVVKSKYVWIQARYLPTKVTSGLGVTKAIAVGGPFLKGHKLFVTVRSATWDTQPVLTGFPSDFSVPGLIDMHYNNVGQLLQAGRSGKPLHIVHIKLEDGSPEGLQIQVNRWMEPAEGDYMNVKINMHKQPSESEARLKTANENIVPCRTCRVLRDEVKQIRNEIRQLTKEIRDFRNRELEK